MCTRACLVTSVVSESLQPYGLFMEFPRQEYWSGSPSPPPRNLPKPGFEPRSPALQADSLPAEPQGKSKNTRVGTYPSSSRSSRPRNRTRVSCITGGFFTDGAIRKLLGKYPLLYFLTNINNITTATNTPI